MFSNFGDTIDVYNNLEKTIQDLGTKTLEDLRYRRYLEDRQAEIARFLGVGVVINHNVGMFDVRAYSVVG